MKRGKLKTYKVWYSQGASVKVRAFSVPGARRQAWDMLGGYKYGWVRTDFLKNATVQKMGKG